MNADYDRINDADELLKLFSQPVDIVMSAAEWEAFLKALDAPPRSIPALKKLFAETGVSDPERK